MKRLFTLLIWALLSTATMFADDTYNVIGLSEAEVAEMTNKQNNVLATSFAL